MKTQVEAMAAKYDQAEDAVHPEEVVADLTTILESDEKPSTPVDAKPATE